MMQKLVTMMARRHIFDAMALYHRKPEIDRENSKTIIIILYITLSCPQFKNEGDLQYFNFFFFACHVNLFHARKHSLPHTYIYL